MPNSKKPVSLLHVFKVAQLKTGFIITLLCCFTIFGSTLYILRSVIYQSSAQVIQLSIPDQNNLVAAYPTQEQYLEQLQINLSQLIKQNQLLSISISTTNTQEKIFELTTQENIKNPENFINFLLLGQTIQVLASTPNQDLWIEAMPRTKNYLFYFFMMASMACITFALIPILLYLYLRRIHRFIDANVEPLINSIHQFKPSNLNIHPSYAYIQEFQILGHTLNTLLEKFESTKQNLAEQNTLLSKQAFHDVLTGLPNRQYFQEYLNKKFHQNLNQHLVLLFIDNNKFKYINDTFGHQAGDAVLIETANRLKKSLNKDAFIARLGGDEFAVILEKVHASKDLENICQKLIQSCFKPLIYEEQAIDFSFSVGASYGYHAKDLDQLLHQADLAMYKAKTSDRHWSIFHPHYYEPTI